MKKLLLILCISILPAQAFEDCVVSTDGKLSDISIEKNDIIDVYPLYTVMNEKNTLFVHPLKEGKTRFCILKNGKEIVMFNVEVTKENTIIDDVDGFDILTIDTPPGVNDGAGRLKLQVDKKEENADFDLDLPPMFGGEQWTN